MGFYNKYLATTKAQKTYVCIGLDSDIIKLPQAVRKEPNPMLAFNKRIIDATHQYVAAYKPNLAFYISQGAKGIDTLLQTCQYIPKQIPIIIDVKAGDIGNTMQQYAHSFFKHFKADAITINILMGKDVIEACLQITGSFVFALAITSNPSANDFFKHHELDSTLAKAINQVSAKRIGAVVGATQGSDLATMRNLMPKHIFLIPGIGAQGGSVESVCKYTKHSPENPLFLINSSRGIIFADTSLHFATTAQKETIKLRNQINNSL